MHCIVTPKNQPIESGASNQPKSKPFFQSNLVLVEQCFLKIWVNNSLIGVDFIGEGQ